MLDVMSGGRMEYGFPLGTGMEYWSNAGQINPTTARARFRENLGVILKTWTEDGPIRYDGEFYNYRYLNVWPRPMPEAAPEDLHRRLGQPGDGRRSPPTSAPATRSSSRRSSSSSRRWPTSARRPRRKGWTVQPGRHDLHGHRATSPTPTRRPCARRGRTSRSSSRWFHRVPPKFLSPPGYVSRERVPAPRAVGRAGRRHARRRGTTWSRSGASPAARPTRSPTRSSHWAQEAQCSRMLIVVLQHGDMPEWKAVKNMHMFAKEVIPRMRARSSSGERRPRSWRG